MTTEQKTNPHLIPYRVSLKAQPGDKLTTIFDCMAEDDDGAVSAAEAKHPGCEIITYLPFDSADLAFVVYSPNESAVSDDGAGFWSNEYGWTTVDDATVFTAAERQMYAPPISLGQDARYVLRKEALEAYSTVAPAANRSAQCQNCRAVHPVDGLNEIKNLEQRVAAGEPMPAGECPACGALAHIQDEVAGSAGQVKVRLTLDVVYDLKGEDADTIKDLLQRLCDRAIGNGMLTGDSAAEVDEYSMEVAVVPDAPDEDAIADFLLERIESGDMRLEDIPSRLARYGIMDPSSFIGEMRERMGQTS